MIESCISSCFHKTVHQVTKVPAALLGGSTGFASFTADDVNPVAGQVVTFTNTSTAVSYSWDFGDGTVPSTTTDPTHYFVGPGPHTVVLTATNALGDTSIASQVVTLRGSETTTLTNDPYQVGTSLGSLSLAAWQKGGTRSATANAAVAPDGTTTADEFVDGTGFIQYATPLTVTSATDYTVTAYFKNVNRRYVFMTLYSPGHCAVGFDLQDGVVTWSSSTGSGWKMRGNSITSVGNGWYRCSMTVHTPTTPYLWIQPASTGVGNYFNAGVPSGTGSGETFYIWGVNVGHGKDIYDPTFDYLGPVQMPAPTSSIDTPTPEPNMLPREYVSFSETRGPLALGEFDDWTGAAVNPVPVGGKQKSDIGVGWSAPFTSTSAGKWNVNSFSDQFGAWVYFDALPSGRVQIVTIDSGSGLDRSIGVDGSGNIVSVENGSATTIGSISLKTWYWLGLACCGAEIKFLKRDVSGSTSSLATTTATNDRNGHVVYLGAYNPAGGINPNCRVSAATRHWLRTIDDAAYPEEIVQPQTKNFIYKVDPVGGSDTANGIGTAWQTITRTNAMLASITGIISNGTSGVVGSGSHLVIDTSVQRFDVGTQGLQIYVDHLKVYPKSGQTYVQYKAEVEVAGGSWSATGGHPGIYEVACSEADTRVLADEVYFENVADLATLDVTAVGASCVDGGKLYIKPYSNPISDGKLYSYGRVRPLYGGDTVGFPVVAIGAKDCWIRGVKTVHTVVNENGSYVVGDVTGFSGKLLVEDVDAKNCDKHGICYTINATGSEITTRNCQLEKGTAQLLTSYMASGSGNVHVYENITIGKGGLLVRSSSGTEAACFYSHGTTAAFTTVTITGCDFGFNGIGNEVAATLLEIEDSELGEVSAINGAIAISGCTLHGPQTLYGGSSVTGSTIIFTASLGTPRFWHGAVAYTNNTLDFTGFPGGSSSVIWTKGTTPSITFTGNTVTFAAGQSRELITGFATADIAAWNNNIYTIEAASPLIDLFNDGSTTADRTFAQWQALGYDVSSTRNNP